MHMEDTLRDALSARSKDNIKITVKENIYGIHIFHQLK